MEAIIIFFLLIGLGSLLVRARASEDPEYARLSALRSSGDKGCLPALLIIVLGLLALALVGASQT